MADIDYLDDSELMDSEKMQGVNFDDIESGGRPSPGQHLAKIKKVKAQKQDWDKYTGKQVVVLFTIVDGPDKGKVTYDRIPLHHEQEEDWKKNKRLLVAKRAGFISRESKETININWKLLEGMTFLIELEPNEYVDKKTGLTKHNIQLNQFKSYLDPTTATDATGAAPAGAAALKDAYNDI